MGEVFAGRYELVDPVGRGGAGAVWRVWDHRRHRYVAAKILQQSDAHALLRFVREQAIRIDHPHVLAPASWAADDDKVLFTMDLVRGGSLLHLIGDYGPLPPRLVAELLDQVLSGLAAVHAQGVLHRDIKPANILLEATGTGTPQARLSDFGIAMRKGEARLTEPHYVVGTPGYFAPEQLTGAEPDFPADLYALGLVALYLLSGQKPDAQAIVERYEAVGTPPAPQGVPEPLWEVVGTLLQPDPYARFRTAEGARRALGEAVRLLPEGADGDDEPVEIFDQIEPLPEGFGPDGPLPKAIAPESRRAPEQGAGPAEAASVGGPAGDGGDEPPSIAGPGPGALAPTRWPGAPGPTRWPGVPNGPYEAGQDPAARAQGSGPDAGPPTHPPTQTDLPGAGLAGAAGPAPPATGPAPVATGPAVPPPPGFAPTAGPAAAGGADVPPAAPPTVPPPGRRSGVPAPSARAVITLLTLAALCFALGFAALAAST